MGVEFVINEMTEKELFDLLEIYKLELFNGKTYLPFKDWLIVFQNNGNCDAHSTNPDF